MSGAAAPSATARDFCEAGYAALLAELVSRGYRAVRFAEFDAAAGGRQLILRHDVDMCLARAATLARIEAQAGLRAAYYVLLGSELYNPAGRHGRAALAEIAAQGHEIGLHFDAAVHFDAPETAAGDQLNAAVAAEAGVLAALTGRPVTSMSFHRPLPAFQGRPGRIAGLIHAYQPEFFSDIAYVSDSQGSWRFGHPLDHPALAEGRPLQLLTHPVWWVGTRPGAGPGAALDALVGERDALFRRELARNCAPYRDRPARPEDTP